MIADFVTAIADQLEIEVMQLGSLTLERELTRAVEPDTCFYLQNEPLVPGEIDLKTDLPPDLVLEIDYTSRSLNKF